jgi:NAD/NADP transhydrogenase beta subunit
MKRKSFGVWGGRARRLPDDELRSAGAAVADDPASLLRSADIVLMPSRGPRARRPSTHQAGKGLGFAGVENELYFTDHTWMLLGAAESLKTTRID